MAHGFLAHVAALTTQTVRCAVRMLLAVCVVVTVLPVLAPRMVSARPAQPLTYPPGWNLVGGSPGSTLQGATGLLYTLQPGDSTYQTVPATAPLTPCWGYWAYFPNGGSISFGANGASVVCRPDVAPTGWVLVGNPSAVGTATVNGAEAMLTYMPGSGYQPATGIPAGAGAWVYANGTVTISARTPP